MNTPKETVESDGFPAPKKSLDTITQMIDDPIADPMATAKKDYRKKYDEDDENFLEYLRDDYENWIHKFLQAFSITEPRIKNSLSARWPLFTGLIGVSYNFGVDWTRAQKAFLIPEEGISKWIEDRMQRLDDGLRALTDNEIYPYLVKAIESSIRYGLKKSISDFSKEAIKEGVIDELKKITNQSKEEILANSLNLYYRVVNLPESDIQALKSLLQDCENKQGIDWTTLPRRP